MRVRGGLKEGLNAPSIKECKVHLEKSIYVRYYYYQENEKHSGLNPTRQPLIFALADNYYYDYYFSPYHFHFLFIYFLLSIACMDIGGVAFVADSVYFLISYEPLPQFLIIRSHERSLSLM